MENLGLNECEQESRLHVVLSRKPSGWFVVLLWIFLVFVAGMACLLCGCSPFVALLVIVVMFIFTGCGEILRRATRLTIEIEPRTEAQPPVLIMRLLVWDRLLYRREWRDLRAVLCVKEFAWLCDAGGWFYYLVATSQDGTQQDICGRLDIGLFFRFSEESLCAVEEAWRHLNQLPDREKKALTARRRQ
jgi:hypothetical protein